MHTCAMTPAERPVEWAAYSRIFQTVYSFLVTERAEPERACLFFALTGAEILRRHHRIDARPVAGAAFYKVNGDSDVLAIAQTISPGAESGATRFHAWVQAGDWTIDFIAPLFPELLLSIGSAAQCERKMFQRRSSEAKCSISDLASPGDFAHIENEELTVSLIQGFNARRAYVDILEICANWYRRPPRKMLTALRVGDARGNVKEVPLLETDLTGAW